jgi:lysozyme family protein
MMAIVLVLSMMMVSASASEGVFAPLYQGAKDTRTDTRVAAMQKKLIEFGFLNSKADGKFGPKTRAAMRLLNCPDGIGAVANKRQSFYDAIVRNNPSQKVFIRGWTNRCSDMKRQALAWLD